MSFSFARTFQNRLALASGPLGTKRLLWGTVAGVALLMGGATIWLASDRSRIEDTHLRNAQRTQNGTGLSGVDDDPYRQAQIQKQEADQAKQPPYPGTVSIPSIESSYLDQQRARRDTVTAQHQNRTQSDKTDKPPPVARAAVNGGMMLGYITAMNAAMAAMTNQAGTGENFKQAEIDKWRADALKTSTQTYDKDGTAGDRGNSTSGAAKRCLGLGGMKVMAIPKLAAKMETDSPRTMAEVEMTTGPLTGYRLAGEVQKHGDTLLVPLNTLYYPGEDIPIDALVVSPLTQETTVASSVDQHIPARVGGPAAAGALQGLGQAAQMSGSTVASGPYGGAASYSQFSPWQIAGVMAGGAAAGAQSVLRDVLPKGSTVTLSTSDPVEVLFKKDVCVPN